MNKRMKYITGSIVALIVIFLISYFISDMIINKDNENPNTNQTTMAGETLRTPLNEKTKVALFKGDIKEKEQTLAEVAKEFNLSGDVTKDSLSKALEKKGYKLEGEAESLLTFKRTIESSIIPNRYYIKAEGEYLAIFKSNDKGELQIEDKEKDIYKECRKYSELPAGDKHVIDNLQLNYETKDEAIEEITSFIS